MNDKKKFEFKPIHAAFLLTILCHTLAIFAVSIYAAQAPKVERMRIIAQVDFVDSIKLPTPQVVPPKKLGLKAPKISPSRINTNISRPGRASVNPGKVGRPGAPGRPGKPGGSGRAGLRTHIDPDVPDLNGELLGVGGYPVGHGSGVGNKKGIGSGFGQGDGVGNGPGGDGGEGGEGGEGGDGGDMRMDGLPYVISCESRDDGVFPEVMRAPEGYVRLEFTNHSSCVRSMKIEGQGESVIYSDDWLNVAPGETRSEEFRIEHGPFTVSIYNGPNTTDGPQVQRAMIEVYQRVHR